jgi:hypothetical protein
MGYASNVIVHNLKSNPSCRLVLSKRVLVTLDGSNSRAPEDEALSYSMVNTSGNDKASTLILE